MEEGNGMLFFARQDKADMVNRSIAVIRAVDTEQDISSPSV